METYNIKLFAHGVPNGQDIWGDPNADAKYIEAFYGRQSNVPSQMLLEVMQFGSATNSYYTYFRYGNFQEKSGRTGGYFALTIRINYYYADIQNIYNLLEAAFNKYILGTVLEQTKGGFRFLVSQLNQANDNLKDLETELKRYLMQFSSNADFVSLSGFMSNGQNEFGKINLLEATAPAVINHVKSTGKISVSPFHQSLKEQQIIHKMNADIQTANKDAQQQIADIKQKAQDEMTAIQNRAKQEVQSAIKEKEDGINAIRNKYKNADRTISQLHSQIEAANKQVSSLTSQVNEINNELQNMERYKTMYEDVQSKLEKSNKVLSEIKRNLSGLSSIAEILGISSVGNGHSTPKKKETPKKKLGFMSVIKKLYPLTSFFVMIILVGIVGVTLPKSCTSSYNSDTAKLMVAKDNKISELEKQLEEQQELLSKSHTPYSDDKNTETTAPQKLLHRIFADAKIDVAGISNSTPMRVARTYQVSLKNVNTDKIGEWKSDDFVVSKQGIMPKHAGACKINYIVDNEVVITRTIDVAQ